MTRLSSLAIVSLLSTFTVSAFGAEKLTCQLRDESAQKAAISIAIDGDSATVSIPNSPESKCKNLNDPSDRAAVEKELNSDPKGAKLTVKTIIVCEGRTGDETLTYVTLATPAPGTDMNTLVMSPAVGLVAGGNCQ